MTRIHHPLWPLRPSLHLIENLSTNPNMTWNWSFILSCISAHLFGALVYCCMSWMYIPWNLSMHLWFNNCDIRQIGFHKLAHLDCHDFAILPYFTPYWQDFIPFVKDLIVACFLVRSSLPSELQYEKALRILKRAYNAVGKPSDSLIAQASWAQNLTSKTGIQVLKWPSNSSSLWDSKKGKYMSLRLWTFSFLACIWRYANVQIGSVLW